MSRWKGGMIEAKRFEYTCGCITVELHTDGKLTHEDYENWFCSQECKDRHEQREKARCQTPPNNTAPTTANDTPQGESTTPAPHPPSEATTINGPKSETSSAAATHSASTARERGT